LTILILDAHVTLVRSEFSMLDGVSCSLFQFEHPRSGFPLDEVDEVLTHACLDRARSFVHLGEATIHGAQTGLQLVRGGRTVVGYLDDDAQRVPIVVVDVVDRCMHAGADTVHACNQLVRHGNAC
jgi:hypothetical protein